MIALVVMPFFSDAHEFSIQSSNLTEVHGNSVDNSTSIVYNVYFAQGKTGVDDAQSKLMDKEKWKVLLSNIEDIIAKRQDGEYADEAEEDTRSVIRIHLETILDPNHLNAARWILITTRNNQ